MADKEISALTLASTLDGAEIMHVVQSGNSRKATTDMLATLVSAAGSDWALVDSWSYSVDVATVDFQTANYNDLLIIARGVTLSSAAFRAVWVSVDGGSTFYTTDGDYVSVAATGVETTTTSAGSHSSGSTAARTTIVMINGAKLSGTIKRCFSNGFSDRLFVASTSPINALRVGATAGNMTAGSIIVLGR